MFKTSDHLSKTNRIGWDMTKISCDYAHFISMIGKHIGKYLKISGYLVKTNLYQIRI